jgi:hypothetical protein
VRIFAERKSAWGYLALIAVVAMSRIPFLNAGYGVNVDAWRVARVARQIALSGIYEVSRFPGYPLQEIICSWFWRGGAWALNGLSALFGVAAAVALTACARRMKCRDALLAGLAFAMTPAVFINSVSSKDYVWAIAFVLGSLLCVLSRQSVLAGALLGLAVGCRITSAAMLLPLGLILIGEMEREQRGRAVLQFILSMLLASALVFLPVWWRYGFGFLTFYENHARPAPGIVLSRATLEVWGSLGVAGLAAVSAGVFFRSVKTTETSLPKSTNRFVVTALALMICIYLAAYLRLPDQAGYLIPIIAAVLLLSSRFAPRICFQFLCACLLLAPFIEVSTHGVCAGAIFADRTERLQTMQNIRNFLRFAETLPRKSVIVVGGWEPQIAVTIDDGPALRNRYAYLLSGPEAAILATKGVPLFYLPQIREFNARVMSVDLAQYGARDLHELFDAKRREHAAP